MSHEISSINILKSSQLLLLNTLHLLLLNHSHLLFSSWRKEKRTIGKWRHSVLLIVFFETVVPALFRSLTRSCRVVLGWFLTLLMIIDAPQGEILHGAPDRGWLTVILNFFYFLIIAPSCCLLTKLFAYCPVAHPSLVQVYNYIPDVLTQLSGLGHCGEVGVCFDWVCGQVSFIHVTSSNRCS